MAHLYTDEDRRLLVLAEQQSAGGVVAHLITYVEMRATLAGRVRRRLMARRTFAAALTDFERDWDTFEHVLVDAALVKRAGDLAQRHALRGYDALHLAASAF